MANGHKFLKFLLLFPILSFFIYSKVLILWSLSHFIIITLISQFILKLIFFIICLRFLLTLILNFFFYSLWLHLPDLQFLHQNILTSLQSNFSALKNIMHKIPIIVASSYINQLKCALCNGWNKIWFSDFLIDLHDIP